MAQGRAEQCRAETNSERQLVNNERMTMSCNGDSLQCDPKVSITRPMCGPLPELPVASEQGGVGHRIGQSSAEQKQPCGFID